jgi:PAS domain S-box-containing protein
MGKQTGADLAQENERLRARLEALEKEIQALRANQRLHEEVAERKRAEEEAQRGETLLRLLIDSVPALISYVDRDHRYRWVNHGYELMFGLPRDQIVGRTVREIMGDEATNRIENKLLRALAGETIHYQGTFADSQGAPQHRDITYVPHVVDEQVAGCVVLVFDITELRRAEERVRQLQSELAHVDRLDTMGEMASGLAHEVNQPLTAIAGYVDGALLRLRTEAMSVEDWPGLLECIAGQARRAAEVIQRLRAFVARMPPHRDLVALNDTVNEALGLMEGEFRASGTKLRLHLAEPSPRAWADHLQIVQVLINLMRNALEAMSDVPIGQRELKIGTAPAERGSRVCVADTGAGLAAEIVEHLFRPFHTTKAEGMGMGLAISRSILEAHGGSIHAEPNPGGGTLFWFKLPPPPSEAN